MRSAGPRAGENKHVCEADGRTPPVPRLYPSTPARPQTRPEFQSAPRSAIGPSSDGARPTAGQNREAGLAECASTAKPSNPTAFGEHFFRRPLTPSSRMPSTSSQFWTSTTWYPPSPMLYLRRSRIYPSMPEEPAIYGGCSDSPQAQDRHQNAWELRGRVRKKLRANLEDLIPEKAGKVTDKARKLSCTASFTS